MVTKITGVQRQFLICICCYIGQLTAGITFSWTGPVLLKLRDPNQSPLSIELTDAQMSLIASLLYIGAIPAPYITGWLSNVKGRKPCLIIGGLIASISYLILIFAKNLPTIYFCRIACSFSVAGIAVTNLVYIGEIASTNIRGVLLTSLGIFHTGGAILIYSGGLVLSYAGTTSIGLITGLICTFSACLIPESPIFHMLKNDDASLKKVLKELGRLEELDELIASKKEYQNSTSRKDWMDLFMDNSNRNALIILVCANIFLQCSGIVTIVLFSGRIFEMAGSSIDPNFSMIIIFCCQLSGSTLVPFIIEKCGRRLLMMISCIMCSFSMFILGLYFYFDFIEYSGINNIQWLPLVILIIFFFAFDVGLGIVPTTLIGEMFKSNVRSKGSAVALTSSWLCGFFVSMAFGSLVNIFGPHVLFWFFSCSSAFAFIFTLLYIPETKGKSLLEIQVTE